jgi:hypothetical protein
MLIMSKLNTIIIEDKHEMDKSKDMHKMEWTTHHNRLKKKEKKRKQQGAIDLK